MAKMTPEAKKFKRWLYGNFDTGGSPLAEELISAYDDLVRLRQMAAEAHTAGDAVLCLRISGAISKANANFIRTWKAAGLSTIELPSDVAARRR